MDRIDLLALLIDRKDLTKLELQLIKELLVIKGELTPEQV
tara:strand:- start:506 stop:625 length:120 start_codon:yes stop_codon:yes gene_type:complete